MPRPDATDKLAATAPAQTNRLIVGGLVAILTLGAIFAAIFLGINNNSKNTSTPAASGGQSAATAAKATPKGATEFGGPMVVNPGAPANVPVLDIYEDPQCPVCAQFEQIYGPTVKALVQANAAKLVVHTMTFLDTNLKNDSSVRAANGAFCAADQGKFYEYMAQVYANQPAKEGTGYPADQLTSFAVKAGVADQQTWASCQASLTYQAHTLALETNTEKSGVNGTPTVKVAGQTLKLTGNPADITDAVKAATK